MSEDLMEEALVALRQSQLAAAIQATQVPKEPIEALVAAFPSESVRLCTVRSSAGFPELDVSTTVFGLSSIERLEKLLEDGLGAHQKVGRLLRHVIEVLNAGAFKIRVRSNKDGSAGLLVGVPVEKQVGDILEVLSKCRVKPEVLEAFDTRLGALLSPRISQFSVEFPSLDGPPRFWVDVAHVFTAENQPRFVAVQERLISDIGASKAQQNWHTTMGQFCTQGSVNHVTIRVGTEFDAMLDEATFSYGPVPVKLVLKLLSQFAPSDGTGTRIAALSVAAGSADDIVQALHLGAWKSEPPRVGFEWRSPGMPSVGDA